MNSRNDLSTAPTAADSPPDHWSVWLIRHAAHRSPPDLAERLEEEWLADLSAQRGALAQLWFALGCCWATRVITLDAIAIRAPAARAATAQGAVATIVPHDRTPFSGRTIVLMFIAGLHLIVITRFSLGLGGTVPEAIPPVLHGTLIDEPRQPETPLPNPTPQTWTPVSPVWEDPFKSVPETIVTNEDPLPPQSPHSPPPDAARVKRVIGGPGSGFPSTADFYPPLSRSIGETGATAIQVCVDTYGRLTTDPIIRESSGSARLDAGALALAKAGSGHYRSTTEDGLPVASCYPYRIRFTLK
jgi:Gram-negative bacterial TonB protein C-terminal